MLMDPSLIENYTKELGGRLKKFFIEFWPVKDES